MSLRHRIEYFFSQDLILGLSRPFLQIYKMSVLGLFPSSLLQQSDQPKNWQSSDSMAKCSTASYIETRSRTKEAQQNVKTQVNHISKGSDKMTSDDQESTAGQEKENEPVRKPKRNKKKKEKLYKMSLDNDADQDSTANLPSTELIGSDHKKTDAKPNSTSLQSTLISEEARQLTNMGDIGSSSSIHKLSSDISVLQDLNFSRNKVDKTRKTELAKQGKNTGTVPTSSASVRSGTILESGDENLQDVEVCESKASSPSSSHMLPQYVNCRNNGTSGNSSNRINYGSEKWRRSRGKVIADGDDCTAKWNSEDSHTSQPGDLVEQVSRDNPTVASSQSKNFVDSSRMPNHVTKHKKIGKENAHFVWQRTGRSIGGVQNNRKHGPHPKHNPAVHELLPLQPLSDAPEHGVWQSDENLGISDHTMPITNGSVLVDSPECGDQPRSNAKPGYVPRFRGDDTLGNMNNRSEYTPNQVFKKGNTNYNRAGSWISKSDIAKQQSRPGIVRKEASEVRRAEYCQRSSMAGQRSNYGSEYSGNCEFECVPSFSSHLSPVKPGEPWAEESGCHKHLCGIQPREGAEDVPVFEEDTSSACPGNELPRRIVIKECVTPRASMQKWIPIDKKASSVLKTDNVTSEVTQKRGSVAVSEASIVTNMIEQNDHIKKNHMGADSAHDNKLKTLSHIGSEMTLNALDSAYSLQLASERFLLATGRPIAEFEKFLYCASPVIIRSLLQKCCEGIIKYQPIQNSVADFRNSGVTLRDVWSWYEGPGNYGLEVKTEYSRDKDGMVPSSAHFVPFLSAVQLFGRSRTDIPKRRETEQSSFSSSPSHLESVVEKKVSNSIAAGRHKRQMSLVASDGDGYSDSVSALSSSDDSEVIFEYFEHEPPQQRKPLYAKVKELIEVGTSSPQVYGDLSTLECITLQDLHPASWYSVAWYPIYRIPEGSLRASFLTYHSLGRLVLRHIKSKSNKENAFCAVSPVLGMQSYNAQVENWFRHTKPTNSNMKEDSMPLDSFEILMKRLRSLEENAALFARGHVRKGHVDAQNRHPDYEFFLTRR